MNYFRATPADLDREAQLEQTLTQISLHMAAKEKNSGYYRSNSISPSHPDPCKIKLLKPQTDNSKKRFKYSRAATQELILQRDMVSTERSKCGQLGRSSKSQYPAVSLDGLPSSTLFYFNTASNTCVLPLTLLQREVSR